jgi:deoxycytidine triphosphate deaminase
VYLADNELRSRLGELDVACDNPQHPFVSDDQIQPCSIDLRLSNVFWEPIRAATVDLRRSHLLELAPRRYWRRRSLKTGDSITLKPGHLLLARVYEKLTIPPDCAGKIEGRSSFSRLGIAIHCTGDFLNPGYRGHMTLQLVNHSRNSIRIFPYLPICQLLLIPLSSKPSLSYGSISLQSKYMDDDGGPSYWWRDKRIKALQESFHTVNIPLNVQEELLETLGIQEPEIVEEFERFVARSREASHESTDTLLDLFAKSQDRLRLRDQITRGVGYTAFPALASASVGILFVQPFTLWHYVVWMITALALLPFAWALREPARVYLGARELTASRPRGNGAKKK